MTWEYLAGFIDGEGCLSLNAYSKKRSYCPTLSISNTNFLVLCEIKDFLGVGTIRKKKQIERHKPSFQYIVNGRKRLLPILLNLHSHLVIKVPQANELIAFMVSMRPRRGGPWLSNQERNNRNEAVARIHVLNRKGV